MYKSLPSENMVKLKKLTEEMCNTTIDGQYELILKEVKGIVQIGKRKIKALTTPQSKLKCYEEMCVTITNIINNTTKN